MHFIEVGEKLMSFYIFISAQRQVTLHTSDSTVLEFRAATGLFVRILK
jgi:hypothetical protein